MTGPSSALATPLPGVGGASIVVIGAGGNIGSHFVPHVGRLPGLAHTTLIDRDVYEQRNVATQCINPSHVGKPKAVVQARLLRRINPDLRVTAIVDDVRNVPLGCLRADLWASAVDSRRARQYLNEVAARLRVRFWVDAGVQAEGLLARVTVYEPAANRPCLECAWDDGDYGLLEQAYPCAGASSAPARTNAPSSLGGLAASLQAIECRRLLGGSSPLVGHELIIDAAWHRHFVTRLLRNPACRFDHASWRCAALSARAASLAGLLRLLATATRSAPGPIRVAGHRFITGLHCGACGASRDLLKLSGRLSAADCRCPACARRMTATGRDTLDRLDVEALARRERSRSVRAVGLRAGDIVTVDGSDGDRHFEISNV